MRKNFLKTCTVLVIIASVAVVGTKYVINHPSMNLVSWINPNIENNQIVLSQKRRQLHADGLFYSKSKKGYVFYKNGVIVHGKVTDKKVTYWADANGKIYAVKINVPVISQMPELPTGCEMTAVAMLLQYKGVKISKFQVADQTPRSMNADAGFIGDPYSPTGGWVFPQGIAPVVNKYLGKSVDLTGASISTIYKKLTQGHPVVVWMANFNTFSNHAIILTGYNKKSIFYNNPWTGKKEKISKPEFMIHWNDNERRALSY